MCKSMNIVGFETIKAYKDINASCFLCLELARERMRLEMERFLNHISRLE